MGFWQALRHAFAVDPPGPLVPSELEREVVERICQEIVRRRLAVPVQVVLELCRPLNYVTAQALQCLAPFAGALGARENWQVLVRFLERRGSIDYLCARLEARTMPDNDGPSSL